MLHTLWKWKGRISLTTLWKWKGRISLTTSKAKMIKIAAVSEESEECGNESYVNKPNNKNKHYETNKRDTLMEKVDQGQVTLITSDSLGDLGSPKGS